MLKNYSGRLHELILPPSNPARILYRIPFLVNMVVVGYLNYWRFKADLLNWPAADARGIMGFAAFIGFIFWCFAVALVIQTFRTKRDIPGLIYLLSVMILTIYFNIRELAATPFFISNP